MKHTFKIIALLLFFLSANQLLAQRDFSEDIITYLEKGNSSLIAKHFASSIDLSIGEVDDIYSRKQAELILSNFFNSNTPKTFKTVHSGKSSSGLLYRIGSLTTTKGNYRVTINLKQSDDNTKYYINQLRFEKE